MPDDWRFKLVDTGIRRSLSETNYSSSEIKMEQEGNTPRRRAQGSGPHCPAMQGNWAVS